MYDPEMDRSFGCTWCWMYMRYSTASPWVRSALFDTRNSCGPIRASPGSFHPRNTVGTTSQQTIYGNSNVDCHSFHRRWLWLITTMMIIPRLYYISMTMASYTARSNPKSDRKLSLVTVDIYSKRKTYMLNFLMTGSLFYLATICNWCSPLSLQPHYIHPCRKTNIIFQRKKSYFRILCKNAIYFSFCFRVKWKES